MQMTLFQDSAAPSRHVRPFKTQLLKWIGNKQRFAHEIAGLFPSEMGNYHEPFLGSAAVMATLAPGRGFGSDCFLPLTHIWQTLQQAPDRLVAWYTERWNRVKKGDKREVYEDIKASYNAMPNAADLLFICRTCYGGVVRFRKSDGYISTPCGPHKPISPDSFAHRAEIWHRRLEGVSFDHLDYREAMARARPGDMVYCDPPYTDSQAILYGAQAFRFEQLLSAIEQCKQRGVFVALSIDGTKRSGTHTCALTLPDELFEREVFVNCGRSMLKRFQMNGRTLEEHVVSDRLLLTY